MASPIYAVDCATNCYTAILEQPQETTRFRYSSESNASVIRGQAPTTFPTIKLHNVPDDIQTVTIRVGLYMGPCPGSHHVHQLRWKERGQPEIIQDFLEFETNRNQEFLLTLNKLSIICTRDIDYKNKIQEKLRTVVKLQKNDITEELTDDEEKTVSAEAERLVNNIQSKKNLKKEGLLGFQSFLVEGGVYREICPIRFSSTMKSYNDPRIVRITPRTGSLRGGDEITLFIDDVKNGNGRNPDIGVRFFEVQNGVRVWSRDAEVDYIHRQVGMVIRTPEYRYQDVNQATLVYLELYRLSDEATSRPVEFTYKAAELTRLQNRARAQNQGHDLLTEILRNNGLLPDDFDDVLDRITTDSCTASKAGSEVTVETRNGQEKVKYLVTTEENQINENNKLTNTKEENRENRKESSNSKKTNMDQIINIKNLYLKTMNNVDKETSENPNNVDILKKEQLVRNKAALPGVSFFKKIPNLWKKIGNQRG